MIVLRNILLFMMICLTARSQTNHSIYLDYYVSQPTSLYQFIKLNIIEKLSKEEICTISADKTKKGTYIFISASKKMHIDKDKVNGYILISDYLFLLYNPKLIPGLTKVKYPQLKYEYLQNDNIFPTDGKKEWWFLYTNNKYYLINENIYW